ncbi:MAG TPA: hypothetical protein VM431_01830 [Phycisphaerae bacterium]|nr:hypothetical protein [Phycisphaerae bacterium]
MSHPPTLPPSGRSRATCRTAARKVSLTTSSAAATWPASWAKAYRQTLGRYRS